MSDNRQWLPMESAPKSGNQILIFQRKENNDTMAEPDEILILDDQELATIGEIVRMMEPLSLEERGRIMGYLFERYPVTPLTNARVLRPDDVYFMCGNGAILFRRAVKGLPIE